MSSTLQIQSGTVAPVAARPSTQTTHEPQATWIVVPAPPEERPIAGAPCVHQLSRDMECLRAALVSAGPLRRWWLRKRLRVVLREKTALEQQWRRRK